jgi:hypothetical protein
MKGSLAPVANVVLTILLSIGALRSTTINVKAGD